MQLLEAIGISPRANSQNAGVLFENKMLENVVLSSKAFGVDVLQT